MDYIGMMRAISAGKRVARESAPGLVLRSADTQAAFGMVVLDDGSPWNAQADPRFYEAVKADDWEIVA